MPLVGKRTLIVNAIIALAALHPKAQAFVQAHPMAVLQGIGIVNAVLRFLTKGKVTLFAGDN